MSSFDFDDEEDFKPKGGLGMKPTLSRKTSTSSSLSAASSMSSKDGIHKQLSHKRSNKASSANPPAVANQILSQQEEDVIVVTMDGVEKGESQAKSDELEYLLEGVQSGGATMKSSIIKLVDACSTPHARFMLRLSGCLPKLLDSISVARDTKMNDHATRMNLALIAFTLLQDRANLEYASFPCVCGLASLLTPLLLEEKDPLHKKAAKEPRIEKAGSVKSDGLKRDNSGWRKKHVFGGLSSTTSQKKVDESSLSREKGATLLRGKVSPYSSVDIDAPHLSLLTLVHLISTSSDSSKTENLSKDVTAQQDKTPNAAVSTGFRQYRSKSQSPMMMKRNLNGDKGGGWQDPNFLLGEYLRESGAILSLANIVCDEVSNAISKIEGEQHASSSSSSEGTDNESGFWDWKLLHSLQLLEFSASQSEQNQLCLSKDFSPNENPSKTDKSKIMTTNQYNMSPNTFTNKFEQNGNAMRGCNIIPSLVELIRISYQKLQQENLGTALCQSSKGRSLNFKELHKTKSSGGCSTSQPSHREVLACALKVMINLTHHHPEGVSSFVNYGVSPLVNCVLFHYKHVLEEWKMKEDVNHEVPAIKNEEVKRDSFSMDEKDEDVLNDTSMDVTPRKGTVEENQALITLESGEVPHFDLLLLSLTVLTNCAEISAVSRSMLSEINIQYDENQTSYEISPNLLSTETHSGDDIGNNSCDFCSFLCLLLSKTLSNFKNELGEELKPSTLREDDVKVSESLENNEISNCDKLNISKKGVDCDIDVSIRSPRRKGAIATDISDENGWEVEELVVSSYFSLLLGCLIRENEENRKLVDLKLALHYDPSIDKVCDEDDLFQDEDSPLQEGDEEIGHGSGGLNVLVRVLTAFVALQSSAGVLTEMSLAPVLALIDEVSGNELLKSLPSSLSSTGEPSSLSCSNKVGAQIDRAQSMPSTLPSSSLMPALKIPPPSQHAKVPERSLSGSSSFSSSTTASKSAIVKSTYAKKTKTYGGETKNNVARTISSSSSSSQISSLPQDETFDIFTEEVNSSGNDDVDNVAGQSAKSTAKPSAKRKFPDKEASRENNVSLLSKSKTWPSPKKDVLLDVSKQAKKRNKSKVNSFNFDDSEEEEEEEDDIFKESFSKDNENNISSNDSNTKLATTSETGMLKKVVSSQKRIKLVKPSYSNSLSKSNVGISLTSQALEDNSLPTLSVETDLVTKTKASLSRTSSSSSSRKSVPAVQLDTSKVEYEVGDHVKVTERTQPGFNKPGGIGRIVKIQESSFDGSLVYDVKYVLGGSEKSLSKHLLEPYTAVTEKSDSGSQLSRSSSTSSLRRNNSSKKTAIVGGRKATQASNQEEEEEDDIFGYSQEMALLGLTRPTSSVPEVVVNSRQMSNSSEGSSSSCENSQPVVKLSKRKKTR